MFKVKHKWTAAILFSLRIYFSVYFYTQSQGLHFASCQKGANLSPSNTSHSCIEAGAGEDEE